MAGPRKKGEIHVCAVCRRQFPSPKLINGHWLHEECSFTAKGRKFLKGMGAHHTSFTGRKPVCSNCKRSENEFARPTPIYQWTLEFRSDGNRVMQVKKFLCDDCVQSTWKAVQAWLNL